MLSFIIPTRDREHELADTLRRLASITPDALGDDAEVIVADNASARTPRVPDRLANGIEVRVLLLGRNHGAAARNAASAAARGDWLVMLDDDSSPLIDENALPVADVLHSTASDVLAMGGDIRLPTGQREAGGLPEVVVGCGCAIRRDAFLGVGGYDPSFGFYVEEYDLCAKLLLAGGRVVHTTGLAFEHRKAPTGRNFARILYRLVRNNAWTIARYAPHAELDAALDAMLARYLTIAEREGVVGAFHKAHMDARKTIDAQPWREMPEAMWERFTGARAVRDSLITDLRGAGIPRVRLIECGKGNDIIERELRRARIGIDESAPSRVVATLSPGPMLDAAERAHGAVFTAWRPERRGAPRSLAA